ncbi:F-box/kelch-repeat protein At3g23880-like [Papaver somniferum]|uniref:F-box/kelch-repeat protein At3g23880-like n=1 Tax=Papaver somniferum TaxID=3469 RepID=UPI000E6F7DD5|nr:F-box/kelch-repeat protein At3g23880-like [Papaver somniferum]
MTYEGTRILSTCNGLIFASSPDVYGGIYIWNPVTKEHKFIKPVMSGFRYVCEIGWGFGYDCGIQDYKVVSIVHYKNSPSNYSHVEVYTLGLNSWRTSLCIPYRLARGGPAGVFSNGALHWLTQSCSGTKLQVLLSFDVKDEDYGVRQSWTTLFKIDQLMTVDIPSFHYLRRTVLLRNGEILLEIQLDAGGDTLFVVYDAKRERARIVKILKKENERLQNHSLRDDSRPFYEMDSYVQSLVSVNSGSYLQDRNKM